MTSKAFKEITSRLTAYYSTAGNPVQLDQWTLKEYYNACFCVFDKDSQAFYSELVRTFKFFPRVSEFLEIAEKYRPRKNKALHTNSEYCFCCLDSGIV